MTRVTPIDHDGDDLPNPVGTTGDLIEAVVAAEV